MPGVRRPRPDPFEIGFRARTIRRRRGLSLDTAAGLAGISKPYLSMLERGLRGFERRGLLEDLANALGCAVSDLTGQPYLPVDRDIAEGKRVVALIERGLNDATLDDAPDIRPRPLAELRPLVAAAVRLRDDGLYGAAGADADQLLTQLQAHVAAGKGAHRREAAGLVTYAAYNAFVVATTYGYLHLAQHAAQRAWQAAHLTENPDFVAFAMFARAPAIARNGGRGRAQRILDRAIADATPDTEVCGLLNLMRAHFAARERDTDTAHAHLGVAAELADLTGERNGFGQHFGPTNVRLWQLSVATELGEGPDAADRFEREPVDLSILDSRDRVAALHSDLARAYAQADGARDGEALRHLDLADRTAPQRIRQDPIARDILTHLVRRARRRTWELDSLRNRFGLN
jgi:transcriptional regulator with XRE-family HTH domain